MNKEIFIREDQTFIYFKRTFDGNTISFRRTKGTDIVEIKLDNNFARANGYVSMHECWKASYGSEANVINKIGFIPEWVIIMENGDIRVINRKRLN